MVVPGCQLGYTRNEVQAGNAVLAHERLFLFGFKWVNPLLVQNIKVGRHTPLT